ncbi:MAG: acetyl-CoA carboxylase biotin carboxyl carrier protein [Planctomycetota bacterium]
MDLGRIKDLIDLMNRHQLEELEVEEKDLKVRLRKRPERVSPQGGAASMVPAGPSGHAATHAEDNAVEESTLVRSPMVGTFYRASSPAAEPFVEENSRVGPGTVLCIIEAMKVMNEVEAEISGVIREILVENGDSVEYGQPLFRL